MKHYFICILWWFCTFVHLNNHQAHLPQHIIMCLSTILKKWFLQLKMFCSAGIAISNESSAAFLPFLLKAQLVLPFLPPAEGRPEEASPVRQLLHLQEHVPHADALALPHAEASCGGLSLLRLLPPALQKQRRLQQWHHHRRGWVSDAWLWVTVPGRPPTNSTKTPATANSHQNNYSPASSTDYRPASALLIPTLHTVSTDVCDCWRPNIIHDETSKSKRVFIHHGNGKLIQHPDTWVALSPYSGTGTLSLGSKSIEVISFNFLKAFNAVKCQ